jgi:hypothetical protein
MGIFDFLFGGNRSTVTVHPDRIWLTNRAKQNGIKIEILKQVGLHPGKLLLVAHFSDVLETLHELCGEISASCEVTLASELSTDLRIFDSCDSETGYFILVAERHGRHQAVLRRYQQRIPICRRSTNPSEGAGRIGQKVEREVR